MVYKLYAKAAMLSRELLCACFCRQYLLMAVTAGVIHAPSLAGFVAFIVWRVKK
jgi:hypothetical protein